MFSLIVYILVDQKKIDIKNFETFHFSRAVYCGLGPGVRPGWPPVGAFLRDQNSSVELQGASAQFRNMVLPGLPWVGM